MKFKFCSRNGSKTTAAGNASGTESTIKETHSADTLQKRAKQQQGGRQAQQEHQKDHPKATGAQPERGVH